MRPRRRRLDCRHVLRRNIGFKNVCNLTLHMKLSLEQLLLIRYFIRQEWLSLPTVQSLLTLEGLSGGLAVLRLIGRPSFALVPVGAMRIVATAWTSPSAMPCHPEAVSVAELRAYLEAGPGTASLSTHHLRLRSEILQPQLLTRH